MEKITLCLTHQASPEAALEPLKSLSYNVDFTYHDKTLTDLLYKMYRDVYRVIGGSDDYKVIMTIIPHTDDSDCIRYCDVIKTWLNSIEFGDASLRIVVVPEDIR